MDCAYGVTSTECVSRCAWESTDLAVITLNAVTVFLGAITGYSSYQYGKQEGEEEND